MTVIIYGIEFSDKVPTVPGFYLWAETGGSLPIPYRCFHHSVTGNWVVSDGTRVYRKFGGLWCRIGPVREIEKSYVEACETINEAYMDRHDCMAWNNSRAKAVMEGRLPPGSPPTPNPTTPAKPSA